MALEDFPIRLDIRVPDQFNSYNTYKQLAFRTERDARKRGYAICRDLFQKMPFTPKIELIFETSDNVLLLKEEIEREEMK